MKHKYFLIAAFTLVTFTSFGQQVEFGLKTGLNVASLSGTVNRNPKWKPGMILGGYLQVPFTERNFYCPEVMYSSQGAVYVYSSGEETKVKLNYLNIVPLSVKLYFTETKDINLLAGAQVGFLLSAKEVGDRIDDDLSEEMKSMDFGLLLGLGVDLPVGVNFGASLNYGLTDISDLPVRYTSGFNRPKLSNVVFQIHVGYTFSKIE